jgi:hypothetical protein
MILVNSPNSNPQWPHQNRPPVARAKPATRGQSKTGQLDEFGQRLFYAAEVGSGKSAFVRQLLGPALEHITVVEQPVEHGRDCRRSNWVPVSPRYLNRYERWRRRLQTSLRAVRVERIQPC